MYMTLNELVILTLLFNFLEKQLSNDLLQCLLITDIDKANYTKMVWYILILAYMISYSVQ